MRPLRSIIAMLALILGQSLVGARAAEQVHRIGYLSHGPSPALEALQQGLRTRGWIEGRNISVEYRLTEGKDERIPELAADLVRLRVDLIIAAGSNYADAALQATRTIPIVFCAHGDPVGAGHVASLSRPGGNVTGISNLLTELSAKQLELLNAAVPGPGPIAVLWNPASPPHGAALPAVRAAARDLGIETRLMPAAAVEEFDAAFRTMKAEHVRAALVLVSPSYYVHHARLAELASQYRLPSMLGWSEFPKAGGLMSYGPNLNDMFGRCAGLVDKLLRGAKPAEIPIEQASTYQLVVNLRAARHLDLTIPAAILSGADEVID
jgi:putative tryptophan/tyrosine transport system substrate-binding protein